MTELERSELIEKVWLYICFRNSQVQTERNSNISLVSSFISFLVSSEVTVILDELVRSNKSSSFILGKLHRRSF